MTAQDLALLQQQVQRMDSAVALAEAQRGTLVAQAAQEYGVDPALPVIPQLERAFGTVEAEAQAVASNLDTELATLRTLVAQAEGKPC